MPWRRPWQPIPVFLPGEFHGQRNLVDYSPWGCKESDTTEVTEHTHAYMFRMGNVSKSEDSAKGYFPNM